MWKNKLPFDILKFDADGDGNYDSLDGDSIAVADLSADGVDNPVELRQGTIEFNDDISSVESRYNGKIVLRPLPGLKIVTAMNYYTAKHKGFSMDWRPIPEMNSTGFEYSWDFQLKSSYAVSENMFFDLKYQRYSRQQMNGYEPLLNGNHQLYTKIFNIPEDWAGYIPPSLEAGGNFLWLSYFAEPFKDLNGDGVWNQYSAEFWQDENNNGVWDEGEIFSDWNEDGIWNMIDLDGNGFPD